MATIKQIDGKVIHQIQSGQVIVDLCSVSKELIENSLDAGATSIDVRFRNQGLGAIEVQDNGSGIASENYPTVALKHHTSKLSTYADIATLKTFGFRGEALASLCALSHLSVVTCTSADAPKGSKLAFELSGELKSMSTVAAQPGTTVTVDSLFHNLPVRRRELERNIKREWGKVISLLNQYACIQTGVRFAVSHQPTKGKRAVLFSTKGNATTRDNIINIFGSKAMTTLVTIDLLLELHPTVTPKPIRYEVKVRGHVSRPGHGEGRQAPDRQMFYVNGRPCGLPQFAKVFNEVYRAYNSHQSPFILADVLLDTHLYDVNVSPDKRSILLHDQGHLLENLRQALMECFEAQKFHIPVHQPTFPINRSLSRDSSGGDVPGIFSTAAPRAPKPKEMVHDSLNEQGLVGARREQVLSLRDGSRGEIDSSCSLIPEVPARRQTAVEYDNIQGTNTGNVPSEFISVGTLLREGHPFGFMNRGVVGRNRDDAGKERPLTHVSIGGEPASMKPQALGERANQTSGTPFGSKLSQLFAAGKRSATETRATSLGLRSCPDNNPEKSSADDTVQATDRTSEVELSDDAEVPSATSCRDQDRTSGQILVEKRATVFSSGIRAKDTTTQLSQQFSVSKTTISRLRSRWLQSIDAGRCGPRAKRSTVQSIDTADSEQQLSLVISKGDFEKMRIIGQFNLGFILAVRSGRRRLRSSSQVRVTEDDDLFIIDQHASDEKYNFERLQANTVVQSQVLVRSIKLELTALEEEIVLNNLDVLEANGFRVRSVNGMDAPTGSRCYLTALPLSRETTFSVGDFQELIALLGDPDSIAGGVLPRPSKVRKMFAMRACRSSIMIGKALSVPQMKRVVSHMGALDKPWNCPHGRPTMRHLCGLQLWDNGGWREDGGADP